MTWSCPRCGRSFHRKDQPHSCELRDIESHFTGKSDHLRPLYELLVGRIRDFGPVKISPVKNAIIISAKTTFLAIKPRRGHLELEFLLDHPVEDFPITQSVRASMNRYAHFIKVDRREDINDQLMDWLLQSYNTVENA